VKILLKVIDFISEWTARVFCWSGVVLILVLVYEVTARYVFNAPTIWAGDVTCMLTGTIIILGLAYVSKHHGHIRVDVFYTHLSPRGKAIIDVVGALMFLFPLLILLIKTSILKILFSWSMHEKLMFSHWYPPATPMRAVMFLGLFLFALQGVAEFIRDLHLLIRNKAYD